MESESKREMIKVPPMHGKRSIQEEFLDDVRALGDVIKYGLINGAKPCGRDSLGYRMEAAGLSEEEKALVLRAQALGAGGDYALDAVRGLRQNGFKSVSKIAEESRSFIETNEKAAVDSKGLRLAWDRDAVIKRMMKVGVRFTDPC